MLKENNIIWKIDSYKQLHEQMLLESVQAVFEYCEPRVGGEYSSVVPFGLQAIIIKHLEGVVVTKEMIDEAEPYLIEHFKYCGKIWNRAKWDYIIEKHDGRLPLSISAIPEGTKVPVGNAIFTICNTDPECAWLGGALEDILQQVWYPTTVCTRSNRIVSYIRSAFAKSVDDSLVWLADFYLHDFGQRAATCMEQAGIGGMAHLVNSFGTDTCMSIPYAVNYYDAKLEGLCHSVPADEHSIATQLGKEGEFEIAQRLMKIFPNGILSKVSDSYDIENAIKVYCTTLKPDILARNGKFVVRPDSPRHKGDTPAEQILWIAKELEKGFGTEFNSKGYKVLNDKVGIIYGDGLSQQEILESIECLMADGFAASTCVFGQGGGLIQKLNRDTCRFAVKACAQLRDGTWHDLYKEPKDASKASKKGRLKLIYADHYPYFNYRTVGINEYPDSPNILREVFRNGQLLIKENFEEIRKRARA
jgi:nicotinamide phosphoribosyltransferase